MPFRITYNKTPNPAANKQYSNAINAAKRNLNNMHNTIKKRYNSGNRSNTLKRMAARYTAAKNAHKKLTTSTYTRKNFKKPTRLNALKYFQKNPNAYTNAELISMELNINPNYVNTAAANVLKSKRNVFENFKPQSVMPRLTQAEINAAHAEMNALRAENENDNNMPALELAPNENNATNAEKNRANPLPGSPQYYAI